MKFLTYRDAESGSGRLAFLMEGLAVDAERAALWMKKDAGRGDFLLLPFALKEALRCWQASLAGFHELRETLKEKKPSKMLVDGLPTAQPSESLKFLPPVPAPSTFRDFYSFEQHVKASRRQRGLDMHPDWYRVPVFYFSNPNALYGHGAEIPYPEGTRELDFELELAAVVANGGRDIPRERAQEFIAGYTVCNDWSARDWQREEMQMNLGPAKGKDFATSFGPCLVTPDELGGKAAPDGKMNLCMRAWRNGKKISEANASDMFHSFGAMMERASRHANLLPGDYIASGTCGTGCILELRPENAGGWLQRGDTMRLEIEGLGVLENTVV
jgi:fumarylacetoacetate (FAA) hydrolase